MRTKEKNQKPSKRDPEGVKSDILRVASEEFSSKGLSGTRIDEIAARTKTSKRMLYYYFGDKEGLYQKCLETAYARVRRGEEELNLDGLTPERALAQLVGFTFDHHRRNPDFIRMVMIENIHNATFLRKSEIIQMLNLAAIDKLADIIRRGKETGRFRRDLNPVELHWQISALSFFNVSNQPTFSALFGADLFTPDGQESLRDHAVELILRYVCNPNGHAQ